MLAKYLLFPRGYKGFAPAGATRAPKQKRRLWRMKRGERDWRNEQCERSEQCDD